MAATQRTTAVGVFDSRDQAEQAVRELRAAGFRDDQIGVAMRGDGGSGTMAGSQEGSLPGEGTRSQAAEGAVAGGVLGGVLGAAAALLIPGIGPVLGLGLFGGTVLAAAAGGASLGALAGALIGWGIPEEEARYYQGEFEQGRTIVTVRADGRVQQAQEILRRVGGYDAEIRGQRAATTGTTASAAGRWDDARPHYHSYWQQRHGASGRRFEEFEPGYRFAHDMRETPAFRDRSFDQAEADLRTSWETTHKDRPWTDTREHVREGWDQTLKLREERLVANKERVQTGQVDIGKRVVEEQKTMEVPVTREEVVVERRPVNRPTDTPVGADAGRTVEVPVTEERVNVEKQTVVREEIGVQKRVEQDTVPVSGTVRHEEAVINKTGETGAASRDWNAFVPTFRQHWQTNYGSKGRWEEYEPMYRYGFDQFSSGRWSGRSWSEVEPELRKDWSTRYPNQSWDVASNPIKHAWDHLTSTPHTHTR